MLFSSLALSTFLSISIPYGRRPKQGATRLDEYPEQHAHSFISYGLSSIYCVLHI